MRTTSSMLDWVEAGRERSSSAGSPDNIFAWRTHVVPAEPASAPNAATHDRQLQGELKFIAVILELLVICHGDGS